MISIGFVSGGKGLNVIPSHVKLGGTIRSLSNEGLSNLKKRVKDVSSLHTYTVPQIPVILSNL